MGTSYDLRCIDCGQDAGVSASYDPIRAYELQPFIAVARALAGATGAKQLVEMKEPFSVTSADMNMGPRISLAWLVEHAGHRIRLVSEYGEVEGTCGQAITCTHCKAQHGYCDKDADHEGDCGKR